MNDIFFERESSCRCRASIFSYLVPGVLGPASTFDQLALAPPATFLLPLSRHVAARSDRSHTSIHVRPRGRADLDDAVVEEGDGRVALADDVGHVVPLLDGLAVEARPRFAALRAVGHDRRHFGRGLADFDAVDVALVLARL